MNIIYSIDYGRVCIIKALYPSTDFTRACRTQMVLTIRDHKGISYDSPSNSGYPFH
ncbi:unnamed protein product, partial [Tuber aestivum]